VTSLTKDMAPEPTQRFQPCQELALLARMLHREGYRDYHGGHLSYRQDDGSLLVTPWELMWDEVRASDVLRVDLEGRVLEGQGTPNPALALHYEPHRARQDVVVAIHNHPTYATVWSILRTVPPIYEQFGAFAYDDVVVYDDYEDSVAEDGGSVARKNIEALGGSSAALLANHGVFVVGGSIERALLRAVVLERRCEVAWRTEVLGAARATPLPQSAAKRLTTLFEDTWGRWPHFYDAMVRRELRADASVLD